MLTILLLLATFLLTIFTLTTRSLKKVLEILLKGVAEIRSLIVKIWVVIKKSGFSKIFISATISIIFVYLIMLIDTNSLMRDVESVFRGTYDFSLSEDDLISGFNVTRGYKDATVELELFRLVTFHNFRDGYIWVFYSCKANSKEHGLLYSSSNNISKWKIHKENGKWKILKRMERA